MHYPTDPHALPICFLYTAQSGHGGEYAPQLGFGWSIGVALDFLTFNFNSLEFTPAPALAALPAPVPEPVPEPVQEPVQKLATVAPTAEATMS